MPNSLQLKEHTVNGWPVCTILVNDRPIVTMSHVPSFCRIEPGPEGSRWDLILVAQSKYPGETFRIGFSLPKDGDTPRKVQDAGAVFGTVHAREDWGALATKKVNIVTLLATDIIGRKFEQEYGRWLSAEAVKKADGTVEVVGTWRKEPTFAAVCGDFFKPDW